MHVFVADHRPLIRQGIISVITPVYPHWTLRQAAALAAVRLLLADRATAGGPTLLIVEQALLGEGPAETVATLRGICPGLKLVVLADTGAPGEVAGADGLFTASAAVEELLEALRPLAGTDATPVRWPFATTPATGVLDPMRSLPCKLTGRQLEVLGLLMHGQSTKDIARSLNLGLGTVKVHLNGIYRSLGARNRNEAVAWSRTQGFQASAFQASGFQAAAARPR